MSVFGYVKKDLYSRALAERDELEARVKELEKSLEKLEGQRRNDESKYNLTLKERDELEARVKELEKSLEKLEGQRELWTRKLKEAGAVPDLIKIGKGIERLKVILPFVKTLQERGVGFINTLKTDFKIDECEGAVLIYGPSKLSSDRDEILMKGFLAAGENVEIERPVRVEGDVTFHSGSINGYLSSTSDVELLGKTVIDGDLAAGGNVTVAQESTVRSISAQGNVFVNPRCRVMGDISCQGSLTVSDHCVITGSIKGESAELKEGVTVGEDIMVESGVTVQDNCAVKGTLKTNAGDIKIGESCKVEAIEALVGNVSTGPHCEVGFINAPAGTVHLGDYTSVGARMIKGESISIIHGLGVQGRANIKGKCVIKVITEKAKE